MCHTEVVGLGKDNFHSMPRYSGLFELGGRYRCDYNRLFKSFRFSSSRSAAYETGGLERGFECSCLGKVTPCKSYTKGQSRTVTTQGSHSNLRRAARERFGSTIVSSVIK